MYKMLVGWFAFLSNHLESTKLTLCHILQAFCYKIPDHVSFEEAAMIEPLSVAVHAHTRAQTKAGDCLLITGCGPIGLVSALVGKASGCSTIIMTDIDQSKLDFAKAYIATHTINVGGKEVEDAVAEITKLGVSVDRSIECSGAQSALKMAVLATRPGGVVCVVGYVFQTVALI